MSPTLNSGRKPKAATFSILQFWWVGLILGAVLVGCLAFYLRPNRGNRLKGFIPLTETIQTEYNKYYGKKLNLGDVRNKLDETNALVARRDYIGAAAALESVARVAAVPAVFNDLGVLYAEMNDRGRCINAFRDALSRDTSYRPVRENLDRLRSFISDAADPVSHEIEPNNSNIMANLIAPEISVDGTIAAGMEDIDCYRVTTPPAPRDLISIEVVNRSKELIPGLRIYDVNFGLTNLGRAATEPGASLSFSLAPEPNATFYLQLQGLQRTSGEYTLRVKALHAADVFEPNDDIFNARRISVGQPVNANIMDGLDTDFFSFVAPRGGIVTIEIHNLSNTLIPALTTFTPDQINSGFGPDVRSPGADLRHAMHVLENQIYYIQVWSQADSAGQYSLLVK